MTKSWTGISYPFRIENGGVAISRSSIRSKDGNSPHISESIRQIVTTTVGERLTNHEIGTNIRGFIFSTFSGELDSYLQFQVTEAIEKYDPRVKVKTVTVQRDKKNGKIAVEITWDINGSILGSPQQEGYRTIVGIGGDGNGYSA